MKKTNMKTEKAQNNEQVTSVNRQKKSQAGRSLNHVRMEASQTLLINYFCYYMNYTDTCYNYEMINRPSNIKLNKLMSESVYCMKKVSGRLRLYLTS